MFSVCVVDVMDVVFPVCIVKRGAVGARVWGVWVFRHADVIRLCLVCILSQFSIIIIINIYFYSANIQFSMLRSA